MPDALSEEIWNDHVSWLNHLIEGERWTEDDWSRAREIAESIWDGRTMFVSAVQRAAEEVCGERMERRLRTRSEQSGKWLAGVLQATQGVNK